MLSEEATLKEYVIDGEDFSTLAEFAAVFSEVLLSDYTWNGNLDAFNDILRGGFGTPDEGFVLVWKNSAKSQQDLGHAETAKWYEVHCRTCHPTNTARMQRGLEAARKSEGETVFDWLVHIIRDHGPGGDEAEDGVLLKLE